MNGLDQKILSPNQNFSVIFHYLNENPLKEAYYSVSLQDEENSEKFKLSGIFSFSENQIWSADSRYILLDEIKNNLENENFNKRTISFDILTKKKSELS